MRFRPCPCLAVLALLLLASPAAAATTCVDRCSVDFVALGDFGDTRSSSKEANVAHLVNQVLCPEFLISLGDNNYHDPPLDEGQYEKRVGGYYSQYGPVVGDHTVESSRADSCPALDGSVNFYPSPGNHDDDTTLDSDRYGAYHDYFTGSGLPADASAARTPCASIEPQIQSWIGDPSYRCPDESTNDGASLYYDVARGPVHFFSLNSNCHQTMEADNRGCYDQPVTCNPYSALSDPCARQVCGQLQWMAYVSRHSSFPWQIVYFHHPPYSSGSHGSCLGMQFDFLDAGIDLVLTGHHHVYEDTLLQDGGSTLAYLVNGLGGTEASSSECHEMTAQSGTRICSSLTYLDHHGALRIQADDDTLTTSFYYTRGASHDYQHGVIDTCTIRHDPDGNLVTQCGHAGGDVVDVCCSTCGTTCGGS